MHEMAGVSPGPPRILLLTLCRCVVQVVGDVVCDTVMVLEQGKILGDISAGSLTLGPEVSPCSRRMPLTVSHHLTPHTSPFGTSFPVAWLLAVGYGRRANMDGIQASPASTRRHVRCYSNQPALSLSLSLSCVLDPLHF